LQYVGCPVTSVLPSIVKLGYRYANGAQERKGMRRSLMLVLVVALAALVFAPAAFTQDDNPSADDLRGDDRAGARGFDDNPSRDDLGVDDNGADSEEGLTGPDAQKAKSAAIAAVGSGTISEVERDDGDDGYGTSGVYEVEVTRNDGSELEVHLDGDYDVVGKEADEERPNDEEGPNDD
jgi:uncharacterized membrane protein YkoI